MVLFIVNQFHGNVVKYDFSHRVIEDSDRVSKWDREPKVMVQGITGKQTKNPEYQQKHIFQTAKSSLCVCF